MYINPETLELFNEPSDGLEVVLSTQQQPITGRLEKAISGVPELVDGMWNETWVLVPLSIDEEVQVVEAERVNAGNPTAEAIVSNNFAYEAAIAKLTADYPPSEIATWERQRAESLAWSADNSAATPWIDVAASARGIPRDEYLSRTYAKTVQFARISAYLTGVRQRYDGEVNAAVSPASVILDYAIPMYILTP